MDLRDLVPVAGEEGTSQSLVRGIAAAMADRGYAPQGFNAVIYSAMLEKRPQSLKARLGTIAPAPVSE